MKQYPTVHRIKAYKDPITLPSSYRVHKFHSVTCRTVCSWKGICRASNHAPGGYNVQLMAATTTYKSFIKVHQVALSRPPIDRLHYQQEMIMVIRLTDSIQIAIDLISSLISRWRWCWLAVQGQPLSSCWIKLSSPTQRVFVGVSSCSFVESRYKVLSISLSICQSRILRWSFAIPSLLQEPSSGRHLFSLKSTSAEVSRLTITKTV